MDLAASQEVAAPRLRVWAAIGDPEALAARLGLRGLELTRRGGGPVEEGAEWDVRGDWNGLARAGRVHMAERRPPEHLVLAGDFDGIALTLAVALDEAGAQTTRADISIRLRGRGLGARMAVQTLGVMRPAIQARVAARLAEAARAIEADSRGSAPAQP